MPFPRRPLSAAERLDWLRLSRSENVGPATFFDLLRLTGSAGAALEAIPRLAARGGRRTIRICPKAQAEDEIARLGALDGRLIAWCEPDYPAALAAIADPPPVISVLGHAHLLSRSAVAVVGARNASAVGGRLAREFAAGLGQHDLAVVSGLARGIDSAAHAGALAKGTLAVLAGGVDVVYPPQNRALYQQIRDGGAILAESPLGIEPLAQHFPRRNRIISGLSLAVVVIEASLRSGSLITARLALEQGREVCAVPGTPLDPRYRGTNKLIRQGATLVESADDVVEVIRPQLDRTLSEPVRGAAIGAPALGAEDIDLVEETARAKVLDQLSPTAVEVDEIIRQCQLSAATVWTIVLELELAGRLSRHPGGKVSLDISSS